MNSNNVNNVGMKEIIMNAIDWTSVKLTGFSTPFLFIDFGSTKLLGFINVSTLTAWLGVGVLASTFIYNAIKIYKEFKNK
jgi:hypothetical protein